MQKVHVRNLFRVYVPLVCPVGHQVDRLTPNPSNKCFGFSLKDTATGQVHLYQLQLYCLADREYAERTYEDWATWGKRHPLSFQKNAQTEEIEGVIIRIKVSHGVFDFRKMKEQLVRISAIYCVDGAHKNQGESALFKILPKRRHGNDLDSDGDEVKLTIDWQPFTNEPKPDQTESRMDTSSNIANTSNDFYTSPSIESYASSTSYIASGSNNNVGLSTSPQQDLLSGHFSDYELMFPNTNLPMPQQQQYTSPYGDTPQMQNENYMVLYNGNAEVVGNFRALNFYKSSDINIKEDIRLLVENHDCRDTLLKIDGVDYKFKKGIHPDTNRRFVGYIAQQVESVVPEAVQLIDGILHVDYEALLPYLSESMRANYNDIQDIKSDKTKFHQTFDTIYEEFIQKEKTKKAKKEPVKTKENELESESGPGFSTIWKVIILIAGLAIVGVGAMIAFAVIPGHVPHTPTSPLTPAHVNPSTEPQDPLIERVLKELYLSTNGHNWRHNIGWLDNTVSICAWYGVSCTGKSVTKLALHQNGLTGTIPSGLFDLTTLIEVDLSGNQITGSLPSGITALTQLQVLQLQQNSLTGTISEELARMASLNTLRLDSNKIAGTIPTSILLAPQLREVKLANNTLTGTIPFVNVTHLDVSYNSLEGPLPHFSAVTTNLNVENNKLTGDVSNLRDLTNIVSLMIGSNNLTGTLSFSETQLRTIKVLRMAYTSIDSIEQTEVVPGRPSFKSCDMTHVPLKCPLPTWAINSCKANCK